MKSCPTCGTVAADDNQAFCLMDGTALVGQATSEPTVIMSHSAPTVTMQPVRKRKTGLWIGVALVALVVIGAMVGLLMYAAYRVGSESAVKVNVNGNISATSKTGGTTKPTPQPTPSMAAVSAAPEESPRVNSPTEEATPITWSTSGSTFKNDVGTAYTFECPPDGSLGAVWGSDVYTSDSSICTAAVHAGRITPEKGGIVNIEFTGGRATYGATTRNGVTTSNYGQFQRSFVFMDSAGKKE